MDDLQEQLAEQIRFLEWSVEKHDTGEPLEAKRLATTMRVLLHKTPNSHALLFQLGMESLPFYDSAATYDEYSLASHMELTCIALGLDPKPRILPLLDSSPNTAAWVSFNDWWNKIVVADVKRHPFTRKDLVLALANKDGGAHVQPDIPEDYYVLTRQNSIGETDGQGTPVMGIALASVRQIAHEVLKTLKPGYTASWPRREDGLPYGVSHVISLTLK